MAKKNNTAEKTILDAEKITAALKEGTEKQLRSLMSEAISNLIKEDADLDEPKDEVPAEDDSYEVEDVDAEGTPANDDAHVDEPEGEPEGDAAGEGEDAAEGGDADDEWSDLEQYKVGDNDYDFTGVDGETALKVFNKLGDDDEIFVTKTEDGNYEFKDDETGAEYVIELDPEGNDADADAEGSDDFEFDLGGDEGSDGDADFDIELDDEPVEGGDEELEIELGDDDDEELNEENLGYTDSYQKDVFDKKFNMSEPANKTATNDWDEGAPKGAEKPWAGKGDPKPFEQKVNEGEACPKCGKTPCECGKGEEQELEEATTVGGAVQQHSTAKTHQPNNRKEEGPGKVKHHVSTAGEGFEVQVNESKMKKIVEAAKAIQAENKLYKEQIEKIKKSLYEAAVLNVNLGKIVSLFVENTTTPAEKKSIIERFNGVKTLKEGNDLYESIKKELNGATKSGAIVERQISMAPSLNETTIYTQNNPSLDLMSRMDNIEKYYRQ